VIEKLLRLFPVEDEEEELLNVVEVEVAASR
jgi:hypothetical protein